LPTFHGQGEAGAYGEFVIETDHHLGRILAALKDRQIDENTLIVFTSDNGPEKSWSGRISEFGHDSRGGLKEGKRSVYEGGHRVPFLVRWPAGIAQPGRTWDRPVGQIDLLATFAELVGAELPEDAGEDSQSFASVLRDAQSDHDRLPLITHGNGAGQHRYAITDDHWKLILPTARRSAQLFDLSKDRAERNDIAATHPKKVESMTAAMNQLILNGRSTPGPPQPNATGYWDDLGWMTEAEFNASAIAPAR
jgi:arylsulfatase A